MMGIERRIKSLEEKTGATEELKVVVITSFAKESYDRFEKCDMREQRDWDSCIDYKKWTPQANSNGFAVFRPNCQNCRGQ
jgi:hypothetical protein